MSKKNLSCLLEVHILFGFLPPHGGFGRIILGNNGSVLELSLIVEGQFYIKFHLCNKLGKFK